MGLASRVWQREYIQNFSLSCPDIRNALLKEIKEKERLMLAEILTSVLTGLGLGLRYLTASQGTTTQEVNIRVSSHRMLQTVGKPALPTVYTRYDQRFAVPEALSYKPVPAQPNPHQDGLRHFRVQGAPDAPHTFSVLM